jgi:hypothetical protein
MLLRMAAFALAAALAALWVWRQLMPTEAFPWLEMAGTLTVGMIAAAKPLAFRVAGGNRLTRQGVGVGLSVIPWAQIEGFATTGDGSGSGFDAVLLYRSLGRRLTLSLPEGATKQAEVLHALERRVPRVEWREPEPHAMIGWRAAACLWGLSAIFAVVAGAGVLAMIRLPKRDHVLFGMLAIYFAGILSGPGTIGCLLLYGRRTWREYRIARIAFVTNLATVHVVALVWFVAVVEGILNRVR